MTSRSDIVDGNMAEDRKYGLVYTKKCGWIDLGHANPEGARALWNKVQSERGDASAEAGHFRVKYSQMMGRPSFKIGKVKSYAIKKGLRVSDKKSVALAIFLDVSHSFESMQGSWFFRMFTNSGYSGEDLVSNLIGFYRALNPARPYIKACDPVDKETALRIWDTYGPTGDQKNRIAKPYIYPTPPNEGTPKRVQLPFALRSISPAKEGVHYKEVR